MFAMPLDLTYAPAIPFSFFSNQYGDVFVTAQQKPTAGITIDHSLLLSGTNTFKVIVSDPFKQSAPVEGPTIKVVDWKDISHP